MFSLAGLLLPLKDSFVGLDQVVRETGRHLTRSSKACGSQLPWSECEALCSPVWKVIKRSRKRRRGVVIWGYESTGGEE